MECPCCQSLDVGLAFVKDGIPIRRCTRCGLGWAEIDHFDPAAYYTGEYFEGGLRDGYAGYAASRAVLRREFAGMLAAMRAAGAKSGRLLEIGCAYGYFLEEAATDFDVWGLEISASAVARCHAAGLSNVMQGEASSAAILALGRFDVVVMLDTIEHLTTPFAVISALAECLTPGGLLAITTGNFASVASRLLGRHWRLMTPPQHLWFFTPTSLSIVAERLGLEVVSIEHPTKIVPLSLIGYQIRRGLGLPQKSGADIGAKLGFPVNLFDAMRVILRKPRP